MYNPKLSASGAHVPAAIPSSRPISSIAAGFVPFPRNPAEVTATIHTSRPTKAQRRSDVAPEKVVQAFNTWAFKREQPDSLAGLTQVVASAIQLGGPVPFVLYWGKGPRQGLGEPDRTCLDFLASLGERVRNAYAPGASFKLIFTDTHATLNGHPPEAMAGYFDAVELAARQHGFDTCWLGELVFAAEGAGAIDQLDEAVTPEILEKLGACASKWFRGEGTPLQGAAQYFRMNMIEKRAVQFAFPRSIFVTFNGSEFRCLFPDRMPIFYMYSLRRGTSVKPWFLSDQPAMALAAE